MGAKFEASKKYNINKRELINSVKTAIEISRFKIKYIDEENGIILANSKVNIWSWSEKIVIRIEEDGLVTMKSQCYLPTQIFDWGKNKKNVETFFEHMG